MPRTSRVVAIGYPHHVTQRGNNREPVFFDDQDHRTYLDFLGIYTREYKVDLWAYCLMPNHIHLLAVPQTTEGLARGIGLTNQSYTRYINRKYLRSGRIWQNRFHSCIVDRDEYLWAVARYIDTNPVTAGLAKRVLDYPWSSARHHLGFATDPLLDGVNWLDQNERENYREFLLKQDDRRAKAIQEATRRGRPFCSAVKLRELERLLGISFC